MKAPQNSSNTLHRTGKNNPQIMSPQVATTVFDTKVTMSKLITIFDLKLCHRSTATKTASNGHKAGHQDKWSGMKGHKYTKPQLLNLWHNYKKHTREMLPTKGGMENIFLRAGEGHEGVNLSKWIKDLMVWRRTLKPPRETTTVSRNWRRQSEKVHCSYINNFKGDKWHLIKSEGSARK